MEKILKRYRLHLLRYFAAWGCLGMSTFHAVFPEKKIKKELKSTPTSHKKQSSKPLFTHRELRGKAFKDIAHKKLPQHIIDYLLCARRKKLFIKTILAEPYGPSMYELNCTLCWKAVLFCLLIFGVIPSLPLWNKFSAKGLTPLISLMPALLLNIYEIKYTLKQRQFEEHVILTDKGLLFCQADDPTQIIPFFFEDMLSVAKILVKKNNFISGKVVIALRITNTEGIIEDYSGWQSPAVVDYVYDLINKKLKERKHIP
ncbi:MAG: hypothetical protein AAF335_01070 [Bacteroidota bacterium]